MSITRYYAAGAAGDLDTLIGCFAADAHVLTRETITMGFNRSGVGGRTCRPNSYTTENTKAEQTAIGNTSRPTHLEGDFPGGVVDQGFTLVDGLDSDPFISSG